MLKNNDSGKSLISVIGIIIALLIVTLVSIKILFGNEGLVAEIKEKRAADISNSAESEEVSLNIRLGEIYNSDKVVFTSFKDDITTIPDSRYETISIDGFYEKNGKKYSITAYNVEVPTYSDLNMTKVSVQAKRINEYPKEYELAVNTKEIAMALINGEDTKYKCTEVSNLNGSDGLRYKSYEYKDNDGKKYLIYWNSNDDNSICSFEGQYSTEKNN